MERCDNKSVGVIVQNEANETLLVSRARFPFGWAAPAGHVDGHGGIEQTAVDEVFEETGVTITADDLELVIDGLRVENQCRRPGGDHHYWTVYRASIQEQAVAQSPEETLEVKWVSQKTLAAFALATVTQPSIASGDEALEPIWLQFFQEAGVLDS